ncbi:putative wall-associated receptor kinase-like 11 [Triticum dicoccoides]|uniref:putative wall-associated receptor kinase-like 11 n=1 Tax=Triticum dicoccoides TaxID=85692 RepID=UPI000E7A7465|nr:putative wall-associated receptor kinase-like 11 [Triticum dicoccoides]XP_037449681.1 putative wall-associated receptor kinase-like 11 [Triticum dicoccoides]XP_037449682.1 putative wall-associated receptor kinase-like 11 [Triticum dicoccoides]
MDYQGSNVRDFLHVNGQVVLERVNTNYNLRSFTQKEIEDITGGYSTVLGEGGFGKVYKGKLDGLRPVAVKRYKNGTKKEEFAKEVIVHSQINHKNVVRLFGCCTEENALTIVMEFACNGNLYNILHCSRSDANGFVPFPLDKRLDIAIESAEVLSCMHSMYSPVLHGDIKPANILLDENFRPKISDFGISRFLSADETQHTRHVIGCIGYMDPLFCQSGILTSKSDVYSFGVVLLEIITRKKAVDGNVILAQSFVESLRKGKKVRLMFDEEIANDKKNIKFLEDVAKLVAECLKMEAKMRPEMVEVADRLRTIRKAYRQRKGRNSTGSNSGLIKSGKAQDMLSPTPVTAATAKNTDKIPSYVVPTISMDELKKITRNFSNDSVLGGLSSGCFFGVLNNGNKSVIKILSTEEVTLEIPVVSRFRHENILQLLGYCVEGDNFLLAYEYASRGSLHDILHGKKNVTGAEPGLVLSWTQRVKIALGAASGLECLHEKTEPCIIHSCIKASNIFLFDSDVAKIGYPGFSRHPHYIDNILLDRPDCPGGRYYPPSSAYDAPEYAMYGEFSTMSDVYSFGVVVLELLTGRKAFDPSLSRGQQCLVTWARPRLDVSKVHQCVDPRLGGDFPPKAAAKMAAVAALCTQHEKEHRPKISIMVKALRPLLVSK